LKSSAAETGEENNKQERMTGKLARKRGTEKIDMDKLLYKRWNKAGAG
jgi:hypothetical protein